MVYHHIPAHFEHCLFKINKNFSSVPYCVVIIFNQMSKSFQRGAHIGQADRETEFIKIMTMIIHCPVIVSPPRNRRVQKVMYYLGLLTAIT
jgi:hypothetical protein